MSIFLSVKQGVVGSTVTIAVASLKVLEDALRGDINARWEICGKAKIAFEQNMIFADHVSFEALQIVPIEGPVHARSGNHRVFKD